MEIVEYEPTKIVKIAVQDLTVPVETGIELSKLAIVEKTILVELLKNADRDEETDKLILHPDTITWAKELRLLLKDINDMTKGVQDKAMLKQMDIVGKIYSEAMKKMEDKDVITLIKKLEKNGDTNYSTQ